MALRPLEYLVGVAHGTLSAPGGLVFRATRLLQKGRSLKGLKALWKLSCLEDLVADSALRALLDTSLEALSP